MTNATSFLVSIHCKSLGQVLWSPGRSLREFPFFLLSLREIKKKSVGHVLTLTSARRSIQLRKKERIDFVCHLSTALIFGVYLALQSYFFSV